MAFWYYWVFCLHSRDSINSGLNHLLILTSPAIYRKKNNNNNNHDNNNLTLVSAIDFSVAISFGND